MPLRYFTAGESHGPGLTAVVEGFYERLEAQLAIHPDVAAVWHVMSLRIRRRPRR